MEPVLDNKDEEVQREQRAEKRALMRMEKQLQERQRERIKKYYYTGRSLYHPNECGIKVSPDKSVQCILSFFIDK